MFAAPQAQVDRAAGLQKRTQAAEAALAAATAEHEAQRMRAAKASICAVFYNHSSDTMYVCFQVGSYT